MFSDGLSLGHRMLRSVDSGVRGRLCSTLCTRVRSGVRGDRMIVRRHTHDDVIAASPAQTTHQPRSRSTAGASGRTVVGRRFLADRLPDPVVKGADVVLAGYEHATTGVDARVRRRLAPFAGVEAVAVDPVEQFRGAPRATARRACSSRTARE